MRDSTVSSIAVAPVRGARNRLPKVPDAAWDNVCRIFPRGLWFGYDAVSCTKAIVRELQSFLTDLNTPVLVAVDEGPDDEEIPAGLVACIGERATVIPIEFRKRRVRVGETDVFVSRDEGPLHLARAIVAELRKALN